MSYITAVFVTNEQLDEMFKEADATGSGGIGFPEFMNMMGRRMKQVWSHPSLFILLPCCH